MTVKDLMKVLRKLPPDMEIVTTRYSDLQFAEPDDFNVVSGKDMLVGWIRRNYPGCDIDAAKAKNYFHIAGN